MVQSSSWTPKPGHHNLLVLHVDALDTEAAERLLEVLLGAPAPDDLRALLLERSGGNPFFLEEMVSLLGEGDLAGCVDAVSDLPATLRGLVSARVDSLSPAERAILEDAAVVGRTGPLEAVEAVAASRGETGSARMISDREARDLLVIDGLRFEFKSDLVREVAYTTLTKAERARRHAALAERLAGMARATEREDEYLDRLAHHFRVAAELAAELGRVEGVPADIRERALHALEKAAGRSEARGTTLASIYLFDQALRLVGGDGGAQRRLLLGRAHARAELRQLAEARADVHEVLSNAEIAGDRASKARALTTLGDVEWKEGQFSNSLATLDKAIRLWRDVGDAHGEGTALRYRGMNHMFAGDYVDAEADFSAAMTIFQGVGDRRGTAWALQHLAWITFIRGDTDTAEKRLSASAALFAEINDVTGQAWALGLLGWVRFIEGRLDDAEALGREVIEIARQAGDRWAFGMMTLLLAVCGLWRGRTNEAVTRAREARDVFIEVGDAWGQYRAVMPLAQSLTLSGRPEEARALLASSVELSAQSPDTSIKWQAHIASAQILVHLGLGADALAELDYIDHLQCHEPHVTEWLVAAGSALLQVGRVDEAVARLEDAHSQISDKPSEQAATASSLALGYAAAGRADDARERADFVETIGGGTYLDRAIARIARGFALGQMGDTTGAESTFEAAVGLLDATEDRLHQALVRLAHGRALEAMGVNEAAEIVREARDRLGAIGVDATGWDTAFRRAATGGHRERPVRTAP